MQFAKFAISRLITYILVVWVGITIVFFVPRFIPGNPVESMLGKLMSQGTTMDPELVESMRQTLTQLFGLEGTLWEQYTAFLKRVVLTQDFGPSLSYYPTPVSTLIARALPWSVALLLTALAISWVLGNLIGLLVGYRNDRTSSKIIETGAMMGVLLDAGLAGFGDVDFLHSVLDAIRAGSEQGRLWAQGTARVGAHYGVARTPVIKRQGISAYDPRVIEVTGISMMVTAQGADHTTGNAFKYECSGKDIDELVGVSMDMQTVCATADSLGINRTTLYKKMKRLGLDETNVARASGMGL